MTKQNKYAMGYSVVTLICTFVVGQIIIWLFPDGSNKWASVLFILINLFPMIIAGCFSIATKECKNFVDFLKKVFWQKESIWAYVCAIMVMIIYYGISTVLGNINYTGASFLALISYFPWTILQGGLEEVGWRWYLQTHLNVKESYTLKMLVISIIWFLWHIPIYRLPWITTASSNYLIFYLLILGNTFTLGAVKELSKGTVPCILAHILIDTFAVVMLVQSRMKEIVILVMAEIFFSLIFLKIKSSELHTKAPTIR